MKKIKFIKLKLIWAVIRGRTVVYNAHINMKGNIVDVGEKKGPYVVNCRIDFTKEGGMIIDG